MQVGNRENMSIRILSTYPQEANSATTAAFGMKKKKSDMIKGKLSHLPYQRPMAMVVDINCDDGILQGVVDLSGETGPGVNPDPVNPTPGGELSNHCSVWDT